MAQYSVEQWDVIEQIMRTLEIREYAALSREAFRQLAAQHGLDWPEF